MVVVPAMMLVRMMGTMVMLMRRLMVVTVHQLGRRFNLPSGKGDRDLGRAESAPVLLLNSDAHIGEAEPGRKSPQPVA
jgi:hypothetical protein